MLSLLNQLCYPFEIRFEDAHQNVDEESCEEVIEIDDNDESASQSDINDNMSEKHEDLKMVYLYQGRPIG